MTAVGMRRFATIALVAGCVPSPQIPPKATTQPVTSKTTSAALETYPLADAPSPEQRLYQSINRARSEAQLPILGWSGRLARAAESRSSAARDADSTSSLPPGTEDPLEFRGVSIAVNIARAPTIDEAHAALMSNPQQREHVLSTTYNEVGVGVAESADGVFVTEAFVRAVPEIDAARVAAKITSELTGTGAIESNADLASIAHEYANALASGRSQAEVWPSVTSQFDRVNRHYTRIKTSTTHVEDVETIRAADLLGGKPADVVGVGVAQVAHPEIGSGVVWVVVVSGERILCPPGAVCGK